MENVDNEKKTKRICLIIIMLFLISFVITCNVIWKIIDIGKNNDFDDSNNIPGIVDPSEKDEEKSENKDNFELNDDQVKEESVDKEIVIDKNISNSQVNTTVKTDKDNPASGNISDNNSDKDDNNNQDEDDGELIVDWMKSEKLNIFSNEYFNGQNKIAPGVSSTYRFKVINNRSNKIIYNISFSEINLYDVNMKYRLKLGNDYIAGNENNWVSYENLNYNGRIIEGKTSEVYTLEWRWFDSDNDTEIGQTINATYSLSISVYGEDMTD